MQLTRLVYASHHGGTSEEALRDIFDRSCKNNANDGCAHHGDPTTHSMNIRPGIPRPSDHPFQPHPTRLI